MTAEEQAALARWSGWGALKLVFAARPQDPGPEADRETRRAGARWLALEPVRAQVRSLLSDTEWADARRNLLNAHYTDAGLVEAVWDGVRRMGFDGGHVLEPTSGSGNYIGLAPQDTAVPIRMTGVEVEANTAAISRHLYPDADIITAPFEDVHLPDGAFDAVVGNIPFGRYSRYDKVHNADLALSIHDHFVLKSLAATRPGGIVALITSRFTMDGKDTSPRERLYELGDLVGAVRLPLGAHREAAGTDVVTDVVFLRRRMPGEERGADGWLTTRELVLDGHEEPVRVNPYFLDHPEHVVGELRARLGKYGPEPTVAGERDAAAGLTAATESIAAHAAAVGLTATPSTVRPTAVGDGVVSLKQALTEGSLGLDELGNPTIVEDGSIVPLDVHSEQHGRLVQLISLKAHALALYKAESATAEAGETAELAELRTVLREAYQAYRRKNPPLTKPGQFRIFTPKEAKERAARLGLAKVPDEWKSRTAYGLIDDDPDADVLFGLEEWDERTASGVEQAVLHTRVLEPRVLPTTAATPEDAFALALEWDGGRLDMLRVASLLGVTENEAAVQISHLAFRDPAQAGFWEPRHRYLSGNVREKLEQAREAATEDPSYIGNVAALEKVQPEDLTPAEIKAKCGAPWIPVQDYEAFLRHLGFEHAEVRHAGGTTWEVRGAHIGDLARSEWGTPERPAQELMLAILRQADSTIQVTYRDQDGKIHVNQVATDAAREKARLIVQAFDDWIWADSERAERLAGIYNTTFNSLVLPEYDKAPLTLPGMSTLWQRRLRDHQNAAVRRIVSEPTALLAHVVGAGKTATMVAGAMELRRTGLAKKPMIVVPNHMLKQVTREFREIYPDRERVKLLAISASDLNKKRRAKFLARIAGGDWDAVIFTHEAFNVAPLRPETMQAYLDREMASLRAQLDAAREAGMHDKTITDIETSLANAEARLQKQIDESSDGAGMCLEDTGIDYVMVDEAHQYKNLRTISAIPGAGIQGSAKATKLHMLLDYLREYNGHNRVATLATGTPIANSVTEAYVLKRYLGPELLERMGLENFDSWAATFGEVVSSLEPDAKGDGYKYKARFARFFNVPELMTAYRAFADVQMAEDLNLPVPPVLAGPDGQRGEPIHFAVTGSQRQFIKELPRQEWVRKPGGVLKALGLGLRASLDMRLVGGEEGEGSKLEYAAEQIMQVWEQTKDVVYPTSKTDPTPQPVPGGLQLVFCDEGTPGSSAEHPVDLYDSLREHLIAAGMPREEIRFIHEASTDKKKERLFADCRAGRVAVLIGSTEKMGTGTNIQDRATALHHLSYPWRPADMAQRDGRIERQGNLNDPSIPDTPDHVRLFYYVTSGSFDEFRLNALARKARFISQIQRRDFNLREIEDIGEEALNLGMLSALASGDPAILQLAEATAERARMQGLARAWDRQQDGRLQLAKDLDDYLQRAAPCLEGMRAAMPNRRPTGGDAFAITIDGRTLRSRDTAAATLGARMVALARDPSLSPGQRVPVGTLGGQDFHGEISYDAGGRRQLKLRFAWGHVVPVGHRDDRAQWQCSAVNESNGRGAIVSLENFLTKLPDDAEKLEREIHNQQGHRADAAANFRTYEDNPYRIAARSKEMEEKLLSKLVIVNEKKANLEEESGPTPTGDAAEKLAELRAEADRLRSLIADEHAIQQQATDSTAQEPSTTPARSTAAPGELLLLGDGPDTLMPEAASSVTAGPAAKEPATLGDSAEEPEPAAPATSSSPDAPAPVAPSAADGPLPDGQVQPDPTGPGATSVVDPWETAVRELTAGGLLDERVITWARSNDVTNLAIPLIKWVGNHLSDRWDDLDMDDWPEWARQYFQVSPETRRAVVARVAEAVHAAVHDPQADPPPVPEAPEPDPVLAQIIDKDIAAMAGAGWTEVVRPFGSQAEATFEQNRVQTVYEHWAATQTALPMLVDAEGVLADEAPGYTNPAGLVASWHHRSRVAAATAGPTGGGMVAEQFEGLAQAAHRADTYLAENNAYAREEDRALLLQIADVAHRYAQRLTATLDFLAQQRESERQESQASVRMDEVRALESAMEYLRDQGADFRMDRRNTTFTDREAAGTEVRDSLLRVMREAAELPPEKQNLDPDSRILYANIRGIPLYVGFDSLGASNAQVVLGFDQLPVLDRESLTAAELEAMSPQTLINRIDGMLALDVLGAVRDRELAALQDLLAAGAQGQTVPVEPQTGPAPEGASAPEPQKAEPAQATAAAEEVPLRAAVDSASADPEVEAVRRVWLQSQDWWVKAAAEGRSGQRLHMAATPGYVLVERTSKIAEGWEVVPANGHRLKSVSYAGIAEWEPGEREHAEAFAAELDQALRAQDGSAFVWPVPRKWRSAEGYKMDRALAEVRAACDRERGIDSSPGINQAAILADRDAEAHAAAEEKKAAAQAKRDAAKAARKAATLEAAATPAATRAQNTSPENLEPATAPTGDTGPTPDVPTAGTPQPAPEDNDTVGEERDEIAEQVDAGEQLDVITPEGPGRLVSLNGDVALVDTEAVGARIYHRSELYRPGQPDASLINPADLERRRQNEADAAQAATPAGIVMRYPYRRRLRDLDVEAGHGTIAENMVVDWDGNVHEPGEVIGWVRARIGDDGKRYWWGQDAAGGPPDDMPFHEQLPAKSGLPALRAAGNVNTDRKPSSMVGHTRPITPPYAVREIKLTTAQVALLRTLPLVGTYPDGSELPTPPWAGDHRRYVMSVAQMQALRLAAEAAADAVDTTTAVGRRSRKVLLNAADKLHFEEYETARRRASIPPIGELDPYAGPYTPPPPRADPEPVEEAPSPVEADDAVLGKEKLASARALQPAAPVEQTPPKEPITPSQEAAVDKQDEDRAELPGLEDVDSDSTRSAPADVPAQPRDEHAPTAPGHSPTEPDTPESPPVAESTPAPEAAGAPGTTASGYAPQDRVFHDAMRYVVESVSPDGTSIRTITGQDLPAAEVVAEADMPPVTTEDLADGWWRYTYEGRSYTATTLPPDLARTHPRSVLNTVIVDEYGQLVGRAFGRPHETAIIWADAHPGVPHPHVAEWLGSAPTPWPDHTPAEIAHVAAGPPPPEADLSDEEPARQSAVSGEPGEQSADRLTASTQSETPPVPDTQTPATESQPDGPQDDPVGTDTGHVPGADGIDSRNNAEEHDMTATPDTGSAAPDVEDPPAPVQYIETTALADPEFELRLYGWDGQPPEFGELLYRETGIAAVRPSQGGGWFARLSAEGLPGDVTSLVATPLQAAHEGAVYFSSLTAVPYGDPIPGAQPEGRLSRADVVRRAFRDTASMHRDLIATASARAWPTAYGSNPQLQHLVERLFGMQSAVVDAAGARRMAADLEAVEQAATVLRGTLSEDPGSAERQHMGYRIAHLLYDTNRLRDHLRAALEATRAEREQEQAPSADRDVAVEPAVAFPGPAEPQPEPDTPPDPETELEADVPEPPQEQYVRTTALDEDARFSLRLSGEVGQDPDYGEVLEGGVEFAIVRYSAAGGWYGQITDPAADLDVTPPVATPEEAAHHSAILYSIGNVDAYGAAPVPAQDTETATRADVVRSEMAALAARHRNAVTEAAARAWPATYEQDHHLQAVTDALAGLASAPHEALYANQMEDRLNAVDAAAMTWVSYLPATPGPERQHMMFPLAYLARDARRLEARLQATAAAVREEREALRQAVIPEVEPAAAKDVQVEEPSHSTAVAEPEEMADQQQSAKASETVTATPDQDLSTSVQSEPIAPQPIPAVPEPARDLSVPVDDRPEAEAEADPVPMPSPEESAESAVSPNVAEYISTSPVPAGDERDEVGPEQPAAAPPSVSEPAPVEPAGEVIPQADLPLWTGPDPDDFTSYEPDVADTDLLSDISALQDAWEAAVLANGGVAHDLREALHDELTALEQALDGPETIQPVVPAPEENAAGSGRLGDDAPGTAADQDAAAVNRALAAADQHQDALHTTPEWQDIQTVRGAARNLRQAIARQTGAHFEKIMGDGRVQAWWKKTSIRICERIAKLATRAADRLRGHEPDPATCMDRLHEAADRYGRSAAPRREDESELQKRMRKLGEGLAASQVKVNAARSRSTTVRKPPKPRGAPADQPGHLRRTAADPKRGPRPGR